MRGVVAAVLLACVGTGCCKTCGWCRDDAAPTAGSNSITTQAPAVTPTATAPGAAPPAPAGRPVGAYGGTAN